MTVDDNDESGSSDRDDNNNLSSVSTILGLSLFCLLIITILIRRTMVHRAGQRYALQRVLSASRAGAVGVGGNGEEWRGWSGRRGFDSGA
jgi:hypothetical protein